MTGKVRVYYFKDKMYVDRVFNTIGEYLKWLDASRGTRVMKVVGA